MIRETIVGTLGEDGTPHITPIGVQEGEPGPLIAPYAPSATLDNLRRTGEAVINFSDDVRVFAGCLTGRRTWPLVPARQVAPPRLRDALAHLEVRVIDCDEQDPRRPRFQCRVVHEEQHAPFRGFNRAQAVVLEAAILVSRLQLLPREQVLEQVEKLRPALEKTAGEHERTAWGWLMEKIAAHPS